MECIPEALSHISKVMTDMELEHWPAQDVRVFPPRSNPQCD
jgi:hypothetical protein